MDRSVVSSYQLDRMTACNNGIEKGKRISRKKMLKMYTGKLVTIISLSTLIAICLALNKTHAEDAGNEKSLFQEMNSEEERDQGDEEESKLGSDQLISDNRRRRRTLDEDEDEEQLFDWRQMFDKVTTSNSNSNNNDNNLKHVNKRHSAGFGHSLLGK